MSADSLHIFAESLLRQYKVTPILLYVSMPIYKNIFHVTITL